jgi:nucleoside-diphosphate-sugar epimerase
MTSDLVLITGITGHIGFRTLVFALHVGYNIRGVVRKQDQVSQIRSQKSIKPFLDQLEIIVIPELFVEGAFDNALRGVNLIIHIASPLPHKTNDIENDMVQPIIQGTLNLLSSALSTPSTQRIVMTSSIVAIMPFAIPGTGDTSTTYTPSSRVSNPPMGPYPSPSHAYRSGKARALNAADEFMSTHNPHFTLINIMPGFVFGAHELATEKDAGTHGSNKILMSILGKKGRTEGCVGTVVHVDDVARIHVQALDQELVVGNKSFLATSLTEDLDEAKEIVRRCYREEVERGVLECEGSKKTCGLRIDMGATEVFGPYLSYERMVRSVVDEFLSFK